MKGVSFCSGARLPVCDALPFDRASRRYGRGGLQSGGPAKGASAWFVTMLRTGRFELGASLEETGRRPLALLDEPAEPSRVSVQAAGFVTSARACDALQLRSPRCSAALWDRSADARSISISLVGRHQSAAAASYRTGRLASRSLIALQRAANGRSTDRSRVGGESRAAQDRFRDLDWTAAAVTAPASDRATLHHRAIGAQV